MKRDQEIRVIDRPLEHRALPETSDDVLGGYAALFDQEAVIAGYFREVIRPGAFTLAIGRDDVRALFNHDPNFVLGRTRSKTLTLTEDESGLHYDVTPPGTTWAKDLILSVKRGDVTQSSFAFRVVQSRWPPVGRDELPLREIVEVELFDVSPVTYPAYEETTVSARDQARAIADAARIVGPDGGEARRRALRLRELSLRELNQ